MRQALLLVSILMAGCGSIAHSAWQTPTERLSARSSEVTLSLLTYNTWGKPGLLGTDEKRRFGLIGPAIRGYDVVGLQETFTGHSVGMARDSGYPFGIWQGGGLLKLNSGLYTLSTHTVIKHDFAPFRKAATWDRFATKGVLFTRIRVGGLEVDVYNTHYQAEDPYVDIRLHDNAVLAELVAKHDVGNPTILLGDFNFEPDSIEYQDLHARLKPRDAFAEKHPDKPGYTSDPSKNPRLSKNERAHRIDYLFVLPRDKWAIAIDEAEITLNQAVQGLYLSDHFGVRGRFRIAPASGRAGQ